MIEQLLSRDLEIVHRELHELRLTRPRLDRPDPNRESGLRALLRALGPRPAPAAHAPGRSIPGVTIREAQAADRRVLSALAELSERRVPAGPVLVAEVESSVVAALPLQGGPLLTDLRRPTRDVAQLLELRSSQIRSAQARPAGRVPRAA